MVQQLKQWFQSKGGFAHVMAAIFTSLMVAYAAVPQFHTLVLQIHQALPAWLQELVTTALALYAWYKTQAAAKQSINLSSKVPMILLALVLVPALMGCSMVSAKQPTAPAVTALTIIQQVQADVLALQNAEIAYAHAGLIDRATDMKIQKALLQEAKDADAVTQAIANTAGATTVKDKVNALLADLQGDVTNGALGVKDAKTQAALTAGIAATEIAVNTIMTAYYSAGN